MLVSTELFSTLLAVHPWLDFFQLGHCCFSRPDGALVLEMLCKPDILDRAFSAVCSDISTLAFNADRSDIGSETFAECLSVIASHCQHSVTTLALTHIALPSQLSELNKTPHR